MLTKTTFFRSAAALIAVISLCCLQYVSIAAPPVQQKAVSCVKCGKVIQAGQQYIKSSDGKIYCSQKCYLGTLPQCSVCGKMLSGGEKYYTSKDGKSFYCSEACISKTWPKCSLCGKHAAEGALLGPDSRFFCKMCLAKPRCFSCDMPADGRKLADGRLICPSCAKDAVMEEAEMIKVAEEIRKDMREKLKISTSHKIVYKSVSMDQLSKLTPEKHEGSMELGLFHMEEITETTIQRKTTVFGGTVTKKEDEKVTRSYAIYLLYGMPRSKLVEVVAHELGHDWMQEYYPRISDLKVKEGVAEYIASLMNELYGRKLMNKRMEANPSEIYGGGYRMVSEAAGREKDGLKKFLEGKNKNE